MKAGRSGAVDAAADGLLVRLQQLSDLGDLGADRLPPELSARVRSVADAAEARLGHGTSFTVVALAGATGSGKSSLFNALVGEDLAPAGLLRPTTSTARAAVFGDGGEALLDWLDVPQRHRLGSAATPAATGDALDGLILLDLPDHDSTVTAHRDEVERLVEVVDVFCWVVDPQKYADAALHDQYLQRFAGHGSVTLVALNQVDRLSAEDRRACLAHLALLVEQDGLVGVRIVATSAVTGEGVTELRRELSARTAERRAVVRRLDADLDWLAADLLASCGDVSPSPVPRRARNTLVDAASRVAGIDVVADAVGAAYRHRSIAVVGWPPVRWVARVRPDPLARLGLGTRRSTATTSADLPGAALSVRRTSLPTPAADATAALGTAGRDLVETVSEGLPLHWRDRLEATVAPAVRSLGDALDADVATADLPVEPAGWWAVAGAVQRLLTLLMVVGLLWLGVLFVAAWFQLPDVPTPRLGAVPIPTMLALGGGFLGLLLAALGRRAASVGAARRTRATRAALSVGVARVVDEQVIAPTDAELDALARLGAMARKLHR